MYFCYGLQIAIYPNSIEADQAAKYYTPTRFSAANPSSLVDASGAPQPAIVNIHIVLIQLVQVA